jgi:NADPH2:quinone reductase
MKAAVYDETGGPEVLRYAEVPDPELRPGGVLVEVEAIGVQGGDVLHRRGGEIPAAPHIVGYQAAGTVREAGAGVDDVRPGQPVVATMLAGSHAELVSVPASQVWVLPDGVSTTEAAGVPVEFATAHDCLFEFGGLQAGETVLVQAGAGGLGIAAVQLAKAAGATVLATASSDERLDRLRDYGLDQAINYATADVVAEVMAVTGGRGVDLVVDPVGGRTLEASIASIAYRGRVVWTGRAGGDAVPDVWPLTRKNGTLTGVFLGAEMMMAAERTHALVAALLARVASGELRVVVDRTFPLAEAADAHRHIESRQAFGRVVLVP